MVQDCDRLAKRPDVIDQWLLQEPTSYRTSPAVQNAPKLKPARQYAEAPNVVGLARVDNGSKHIDNGCLSSRQHVS